MSAKGKILLADIFFAVLIVTVNDPSPGLSDCMGDRPDKSPKPEAGLRLIKLLKFL